MVALLLACTADVRLPPADEGAGVEDIPDVVGEDTAAEDTAVEDTAAPDTGDDVTQDDVFATDRVHTVEITLADADVSALRDDPYTWVAADVTYDGQAFPGVGLRIKGRLGSYRSIDSKSAFKVDFLQWGGAEKLAGLEKLNLNNMVQDCAFFKEYASYAVYSRAADTPAPRVAWAWVTVNGEPYGLYSVVEEYDDELLQRAFVDPTGNLYDGDYFLNRDGSYTLLDFEAGTQDMLELDEGTDVGHADVHALTEAAASASFEQATANLLDLDRFVRFFAATAWIGHSDSYVYYRNNYRVYFDPGNEGRAVFLPWDPDWAFASLDPNAPYGVLAAACFADPACVARFRTAAPEVFAGIDASTIAAELGTHAEMLLPYVADDPRKELTPREARQCQASVVSWFGSRSALLSATFGL